MESCFHPWSDCATCKHVNFLKNTCDAFPNGIPDKIYGNRRKHREVLPDQEGEWVYEIAQWAIDSGVNTNRPVLRD